MKLKIIKPNRLIRNRIPARIRIDTKMGRIAFSRSAVAMMGLQNMQGIAFYQDEDNPKDWYILPTPQHTANSHRLYIMKGDIYTSCTSTSMLIASSLNIDNVRFSMLIGSKDEDTSMYPIITKSAK